MAQSRQEKRKEKKQRQRAQKHAEGDDNPPLAASPPPPPKLRLVIARKDQYFVLRGTEAELLDIRPVIKWAFFIFWRAQEGEEFKITQVLVDHKNECTDPGIKYVVVNEEGLFKMGNLDNGHISNIQPILDLVPTKKKHESEKFGQLACQKFDTQYPNTTEDVSVWGETVDDTAEYDPDHLPLESAQIRGDDGTAYGISEDKDGSFHLVRINDIHPSFPCAACTSIEHDVTHCNKRNLTEYPCLNCGQEHVEEHCDNRITMQCSICKDRNHWRSFCPHLQRPPKKLTRMLIGHIEHPTPRPEKLHQLDFAGIGAMEPGKTGTEARRGEDRIDEHGTIKAPYVSGSFAAVVTFTSARIPEDANEKLDWSVQQFIAPYSDKYISSLAQSFTPGIRTQVEVDNAALAAGTVRLAHSYCPESQSRGTIFANTHIDMSALIAKPTAEKVKSTTFDHMAKEMRPSYNGQSPLPATNLGMRFQHNQFHEGMHHIEINSKIQELTHRYGKEFTTANQSLHNVFDAVHHAISLSIFIPTVDTDALESWTSFFRKYDVRHIHPLREAWTKCNINGEFTDVSQIPSDAEIGVKQQENPRIWMTPEERSTLLTIAVHREYLRSEGIASITDRTTYPAVCFPVANKNSTSYPTEFLVVLRRSRDYRAMPRPLDQLAIEILDIKWQSRLPEKLVMTLDQKVEAVSKYIIFAGMRARDFANRDATRAIFYHTLQELCVTDNVDTTQREKWIRQTADKLLPERNKEDKETPEHWRERIGEFVEKHIDTLLQVPARHKTELPLCHATCVELDTAWSEIGHVAFHVRAPSTPGWTPEMGPDPRLQIELPTISCTERFDEKKYVQEAVQKANDDKFAINVILRQKVNDQTLNAHLSALAASVVDKTDTTDYAKLMRWTANFDDRDVILRDATEFPVFRHIIQRRQGIPFDQCTASHTESSGNAIPTEDTHTVADTADQEITGQIDLAKAAQKQVKDLHQRQQDQNAIPTTVRRGISQSESDALLAHLDRADPEQLTAIFHGNEQLPHGFKLIQGCPGGGKTFIVAFILCVCLWDPPFPKQIDEPKAKDVFTAALAEDSPTKNQPLQKVVALVIAASQEQLNDASDKIQSTLNILDPNGKHLVVRAAPPQRVTRQIGREDEEDQTDALRNLLDPERAIRDIALQATQGHGNIPTVFKSPQSITNLIQQRLEYDKEDSNVAIIRQNFAARKQDPLFWIKSGRKAYEKAMKNLITKVLRQADVIVCTAFAAHTIAEFVQPTVLWVDEAFRSTEADMLLVLTKFRTLRFQILSGDQHQLGIEVFSTDMHRTKDEDFWFLNVTARQLETSMPQRMIKANVLPEYKLRRNHRSVGFVSAIPSAVFYNGEMEEATEIPEDEYDNHPLGMKVKRNREFLQGLTSSNARGSSIWIDIRGDTETKHGTSYANDTEARMTVEIIKSIFKSDLYQTAPNEDQLGKRATVAILSPYAAQVDRIKHLLQRLHPAEWVPELVDTRTARGMQGNEADVIIISLVRSKSPGFLSDRRLMTSILTRATTSNIIIGNSDMWTAPHMHPASLRIQALAAVFDHHAQRQAVYTYNKDTTPFTGQYCEKCSSFHDPKESCWPQCTHCRGSHHVHQCTTNPEPMTSELKTLRTVDKWHKDNTDEVQYVAPRARRTFKEIRGMEDELKPRERTFRMTIDMAKVEEERRIFFAMRQARKAAKEQAKITGEEILEEEELEGFLMEKDTTEEQEDQENQDQQDQEEEEQNRCLTDTKDMIAKFPNVEMESPQHIAMELEQIAEYIIRRHSNIVPTPCLIPLKGNWNLSLGDDHNLEVAFINYEDKAATIFTNVWSPDRTEVDHIGFRRPFPEQVMWYLEQKIAKMPHTDDVSNILPIPLEVYKAQTFKDDKDLNLKEDKCIEREQEFANTYGRSPQYVEPVPRDGNIDILLDPDDDYAEPTYTYNDTEITLRYYHATDTIEPPVHDVEHNSSDIERNHDENRGNEISTAQQNPDDNPEENWGQCDENWGHGADVNWNADQPWVEPKYENDW